MAEQTQARPAPRQPAWARLDRALGQVTMYRLALLALIGMLAGAVALSAAGALPYDPFALVLGVAALVATCKLANMLFAWAWGVPENAESAYISALILALILTPAGSVGDLPLFFWAGVLAMASKYIVAVRGRHIFNPVAFGVALTALALGQTASWWVGTPAMLPLVLAGGLPLVRRLGRYRLVLGFLAAAAASTLAGGLLAHRGLAGLAQGTLLYSPLLFFAAVILTEPLTTPPTAGGQLLYGALVGLLMAPDLHVGDLYLTPELAILAGNVLSFALGSRQSLALTLRERVQIAPDIFDFVFDAPRRVRYRPGQYMEWTLAHEDPDSRGNRRFFTLASSPTEGELRVGVKFSADPSSYKEALMGLPPGGELVATNLAGDFTPPRDPRQRCVLIAGGIGVSPFRSWLKYLVDTRQRRPVVLLWANRRAADIVYRDVLDQAERELGIRTVYTISEEARPPEWRGAPRQITPELIRVHAPDYMTCRFYLSGSRRAVDSFRATLAQMGVPARNIRTDYFSGLA